jgi:hypothetical protein
MERERREEDAGNELQSARHSCSKLGRSFFPTSCGQGGTAASSGRRQKSGRGGVEVGGVSWGGWGGGLFIGWEGHGRETWAVAVPNGWPRRASWVTKEGGGRVMSSCGRQQGGEGRVGRKGSSAEIVYCGVEQVLPEHEKKVATSFARKRKKSK